MALRIVKAASTEVRGAFERPRLLDENHNPSFIKEMWAWGRLLAYAYSSTEEETQPALIIETNGYHHFWQRKRRCAVSPSVTLHNVQCLPARTASISHTPFYNTGS